MLKVAKIDRVIQEITKRILIVLSIKVALKINPTNNSNSISIIKQGKVKKDRNLSVNNQSMRVRMQQPFQV